MDRHFRTRPRASAQGLIVILLVLALAAGYWLYTTGRIGGYGIGGGSPAPAATPAGPAAPAAGGAKPRATSARSARPEAPDLNLGGRLFDMDGDADDAASDAANPLPAERDAGAESAVAAARAGFEQARKDAEQRASSPALTAMRAEVAAADAEVQRLRDANMGGSSEMVAASRKSITAKGKLRKLLEAATATDPSVTAARTELKTAEAVLRAARSAPR